MPVVFTPYLKRVTERVTDSEETEEYGGPSRRRLAVGAAIAAAGAALAAWRLRRAQTEAERRERARQQAEQSGDDRRLRRVGKGWIRR